MTENGRLAAAGTRWHADHPVPSPLMLWGYAITDALAFVVIAWVLAAIQPSHPGLRPMTVPPVAPALLPFTMALFAGRGLFGRRVGYLI